MLLYLELESCVGRLEADLWNPYFFIRGGGRGRASVPTEPCLEKSLDGVKSLEGVKSLVVE